MRTITRVAVLACATTMENAAMSALGHKQTYADVRFTPQKRTLVRLFNHLIGAFEQRRRDRHTERFSGFQVDD